MIYQIIVAVESIGLIVCLFIISNLLNQINQLENHSNRYVNRIIKQGNDFDKYYEYLVKLFSETYAELQRIDKRGAFSSDDEVGFAFRVVQLAIEETKEKLLALKVKDPEEEKTPAEK